jgi:hypothetical protein
MLEGGRSVGLIAALKAWLGTARLYLWNSLLRVPWLCSYNTAGAVLLVYLFAFNDQGQDLLRISAELGFSLRGLLWNLLFLLGTGLLSFSLWYSSRLLLGRDFPTYVLDERAAAPGRRWLPRLLGAMVPLAIGVSFLRLESGTGVTRAGLGALFLALGVGLLAFYVARRRMPGVDPRLMLEVRPDYLPASHRQRMTAAIAGSFVLLVAFMLSPVRLPQVIGAPAIAVLGVAGIALFGSMVLTYLLLARGAPAATTLALGIALAAGLLNDNHAVRLADQAPALERLPPSAHHSQWRYHHPVSGPTGPEPIVLVSASGGGIRAAYWTASALAHMEGIAGFSHNLFAVSGVSGGSLGAATYVTLKRAQLEGGAPGHLLDAVRGVLAQDFLSPVVAGLLFPDLAQRFVPVPVPWADRQRFLEQSWEQALGGAVDVFAGAFTALYGGDLRFRLPSLLLNATVVETGQRAVVSNLSLEDFSDTVDLLDPALATRGVRVSSAAGLSARFTYVSPAGTVARGAQGSLRVVDGGYFENSGAASIADLLNLMRQSDRAYLPILVLIRNDPQAPAVCRATAGALEDSRAGAAGGRFNATVSDVLAPVQTLLHTRQARGRLAEVEAARAVEALGGVVVEVPLAAVTATSLTAARSPEQRARARARMVEPPLGWSLSEEVRAAMDAVLDEEAGGLRAQFATLRAALAGHVDPSRRCNAH